MVAKAGASPKGRIGESKPVTLLCAGLRLRSFEARHLPRQVTTSRHLFALNFSRVPQTRLIHHVSWWNRACTTVSELSHQAGADKPGATQVGMNVRTGETTVRQIAISLTLVAVCALPAFAQTPTRKHAETTIRWALTTLPITKAISTNLQSLTAASESRNILGVVRGCRTLKLNVVRLSNTLPAPDSELDDALSAAVAAYTESVDHCIRGEIGESIHPMREAGEHINRASARLSELTNALK